MEISRKRLAPDPALKFFEGRLERLNLNGR